MMTLDQVDALENAILPDIPRYSRIGTYPLELPTSAKQQPLKVAIVYAVCYRFRMPIFRRLSAHPSLKVRVIVGSGIPGTKFSNAPDLSGIDHRILWTLKKAVNSSGRKELLTFNPTLLLHLVRFRPDVLLIQGGMVPNNLITLLYAKLTRTPIVWWSLGQVVGREFKGLSALYHRINQWIERQATCYAGYSSAAIHYFRGLGYDPFRCFNLVNVVDTDLVKQNIAACQDRVPALSRKLGLAGKRVVLFVGSLTPTKGIKSLIRAYATLTDLHQDMRLLIVGDGPERAEAMRLADQLGLANNATFVGAVYEGVEAYFQLGDLLVMPGTGGLAISEGMAHGLPVICSIGDGVEVDLIDVGLNGYRVQSNNVEELASKMRLTLQDSERLTEMGRHSCRIIAERANIDRYINEMLSAVFFAYDQRRGDHG